MSGQAPYASGDDPWSTVAAAVATLMVDQVGRRTFVKVRTPHQALLQTGLSLGLCMRTADPQSPEVRDAVEPRPAGHRGRAAAPHRPVRRMSGV